MTNMDNSDLIMWKMARGRYLFQTNSSKLHRRMRGRKNFELSCYSTNEPLGTYYCDLPDISQAKKRFKSLTSRNPKHDLSREIYY